MLRIRDPVLDQGSEMEKFDSGNRIADADPDPEESNQCGSV